MGLNRAWVTAFRRAQCWLQLHFIATGKPETCASPSGSSTRGEDVQKQPLHPTQLRKFAIPPGDPAHKVTASRTLEHDTIGIAMFSHMHLRGKDMTFTASSRRQEKHAADHPQLQLLLANSLSLGAGQDAFSEGHQARIRRPTSDNSTFNPYNPDRRQPFGTGRRHITK